jgi:hypothetical protein
MYIFSIKQNTELDNENQLKLAFNEYENFMENYKKFIFFFNFREKIDENKDDMLKNIKEYE